MKNTLIGTVTVTSKGVGYVEIIDPKNPLAKDPEEAEIAPENLHTALHNDEVEVRILKKGKGGLDRTQGEVVRIVARAKTEFVGTLEQEKGHLFLVPDDRRCYRDIELDAHDASGAAAQGPFPAGTKALVTMTSWVEGKNPQGKLVRVIGQKGNNDVEMESIVLEKGFETSFPREVEAEAEHLHETESPIPAAEITKRRDFRQTLTFTIDPFDAKDFDDAISLKDAGKDASGQPLYEIGVHIADVSHYVRPKTALDREAQKRALSVYLVDRTIPMLPEALSNDMCSLNPNEDKLTFTAAFIMDMNGNIHERWFGKTVINSDKRFTYEAAQESIVAGAAGAQNATSGATASDKPYVRELTILNEIAKKLAQKKFAAGAIDFEKDEVKFELDKNGKPLRVILKKRFDAHKLVEEYMLLANREVAEFIFEKDKGKKDIALQLLHNSHSRPRRSHPLKRVGIDFMEDLFLLESYYKILAKHF
jgi:ribonuclease R